MPSQPPCGHRALVSSHYPPSLRFFFFFFTLWSTFPSPGEERLDISSSPDEIEALHLYNHRQLVPSDYEALNAILSTVAHINTGRDYTTPSSHLIHREHNEMYTVITVISNANGPAIGSALSLRRSQKFGESVRTAAEHSINHQVPLIFFMIYKCLFNQELWSEMSDTSSELGREQLRRRLHAEARMEAR